MRNRKIIMAIFSSLGILILILDGKTALSEAASGLELCLKTVIPSLFPFLFLCSILTGSLWGIPYPWLRPLGKRLGIPEGAESVLIAAVLGGYPAGAQAIGEAFRENRLSRQDAEHLLSFCSNAGPAFLFGMVSLQFPEKHMVWAIWGILIWASLLTGYSDGRAPEEKATFPPKGVSATTILMQTVKTMGSICGWILLFAVLTAFLNRWLLWAVPEWGQVLITGLLEISSGCCGLQRIENLPLRFLTGTAFLSYGGLCVTMQTASVIGDLSLKAYLRGKLLQTAFALGLTALYLQFGWMVLIPAYGIFLLPAGLKKRGRFPASSGV